MTGTVHFSVPDTDRSSSRLVRPCLQRPVSMEEADNSVNEIHESFPRQAAVRLYRQLSSGFNSRTIRCILVVSLFVNLILAVLLGIFIGFWQSSARELDRGTPPPSIATAAGNRDQMYSCFPCSDDGGIPGLVVAVRSSNGMCCTKDRVPGFEKSNRYLQLTRDYVRAHCPDKGSGWGSGHHNNDQPRRNEDAPAAAHLTLDVVKSKENLKTLPDGQRYLSWNVHDETGVSFISDQLRYSNGTITVPTSGRYHVYAQLTFDTYANSLPDKLQQLVVEHTITRISKGSPFMLLLDRVNLLRRVVTSSDLEGTFELKKGDMVKVSVSYPTYLYNLPQTNNFGLFKLMSG